MTKKKITEIVAACLKDFLQQNGLELYHTEFLKEGKDWFLRVYIDRKPLKLQADGSLAEADEAYVSTEDCEKVSRFLSEELDRLDPIAQNYYLEVSSPGLDRLLYGEEHFRRYAGRQVEINLYKGIDGKKTLHGVLLGLHGEGDEAVVVMQDEQQREIQLARGQIARARLAVVF